jgi:hypothetical protein
MTFTRCWDISVQIDWKNTKIHDLQLRDDFKNCEQFSIAKARQKYANKDWKGRSQVSGERLYLDISSIEDLSYREFKFWALIADYYTDYSWSIFLKNKMLTLSTDLNIARIDVKFIR